MGWQGHEIQYYCLFPCFFNINNTPLKIIIIKVLFLLAFFFFTNLMVPYN